jgi:hypothetical protein
MAMSNTRRGCISYLLTSSTADETRLPGFGDLASVRHFVSWFQVGECLMKIRGCEDEDPDGKGHHHLVRIALKLYKGEHRS